MNYIFVYAQQLISNDISLLATKRNEILNSVLVQMQIRYFSSQPTIYALVDLGRWLRQRHLNRRIELYKVPVYTVVGVELK